MGSSVTLQLSAARSSGGILSAAAAVFSSRCAIQAVRGVKLIEVDALESQTLQATVQRPAQMLGAAVRVPAAPSGAHDPALGADDQAFGVGMQGFSDEGLGSVRPVAVGGVEEIDAEL